MSELEKKTNFLLFQTRLQICEWASHVDLDYNYTEKKRRAVGIILRLYRAGLNIKRTGVGIVSIYRDRYCWLVQQKSIIQYCWFNIELIRLEDELTLKSPKRAWKWLVLYVYATTKVKYIYIDTSGIWNFCLMVTAPSLR